VYVDRRMFIRQLSQGAAASSMALAAITAMSGCGSQAPTAPSTDPPTQTPQPGVPTSSYGKFYRGSKAGSGGTIEEVLRAAKLVEDSDIKGLGQVIRIGGRTAQPVTAGQSSAKVGYFFHVNGTWVRNPVLKTGDSWDAFDWNGTDPPGLGAS
jgi:hypothetical protein